MKKPTLIYLVGKSGCGKSTLANALKLQLDGIQNDKIQIIDGDVIRSQFGDVFGYTYDERMKCNKVVRTVVEYLIKNEVSVILAQVAPYNEMRSAVRAQFGENYIQVYLRCSEEELIKRDTKGYYHRANIGEMSNLSGYNDVYESPYDSEIEIDTENTSVEKCVQIVVDYMKSKEYV